MPQTTSSPKPKDTIREAALRLANTFVFRDAVTEATVSKTAKKRDMPSKPVAGHKRGLKSWLREALETFPAEQQQEQRRIQAKPCDDGGVPLVTLEDENDIQHLALESLSLASAETKPAQSSTVVPIIVVTQTDEDVSSQAQGVSALVSQRSEVLKTCDVQSKSPKPPSKSATCSTSTPAPASVRASCPTQPPTLASPSIPSFTFSCEPTAPFTAFDYRRTPPPPLPSFSMFRELSTLALPRDCPVSTPILPGPPLPVPLTLPSFNELVASIECTPSRTFAIPK
ncbi:hypothetical protein RRF57_002770 [Xylaria bambusicola]|uniref:Uncharacterized protein n=1 Tax=Xylaria bambusicola TaxID=326684 RepID=A0AAN7U7M1_9PEZI